MASVRLVDIARAAGVSVSAVSKALSGSHEISAETKARICDIAEGMGYQSNSMARSLRLGKNNMLGVIIPNNTSPFYSSILQGVAERARAAGYVVIIANSNEDVEQEAAAIRSMLSIPVAGLLATPVSLANYKNVKTNLVFISRYPYRALTHGSLPDIEDISGNYVVNDDFEGEYLAVKRLTEKGLKDIYLLLDSSDRHNVSTFKSYCRLDGYRLALEEAGIPFDASKVVFDIDSNSIELCHDAVKEICRRAKPPFGIAATNDYVSFGAYKALGEAGLRIPDDVCVVGYDDIPLAQQLSPALTSVHPANKELGIYGAMHIIDMIDGTIDKKQKISTVLKPYLVPRGSA